MEKAADPSLVLPSEILVLTLSCLPWKQVVSSCSLVNKKWHQLTNEPQLWKMLLFDAQTEHFLELRDKLFPNKQDHLTDEDRIRLVEKLEETEKGIENARATHKDKAQLSDWKLYFVWKVSYVSFKWCRSERGQISEDGKKVVFPTGGHSNLWGDAIFEAGIHRWKILVEGIESNGFWCALGVCTRAKENTYFTYRTDGNFTGYSGAGDILSKDGEHGQGTATRWKPGDIITLCLDCNTHTLTFWINDTQLTPLNTLHEPLMPWGNSFVQGCTFTLLH